MYNFIYLSMKVRILEFVSGAWTDASIIEGKHIQLPSFQDGWRFNFSTHAKVKGAAPYILIAEETPGIIEGCLIYKMRGNVEPYMAYVEIAQWNQGKNKKYDRVAGCLVAFACRLSFVLGKGDYKGWLAFDVQEQHEEDQRKLMVNYSRKYKARRVGETTMLIMPEDGEQLIEEYLEKH